MKKILLMIIAMSCVIASLFTMSVGAENTNSNELNETVHPTGCLITTNIESFFFNYHFMKTGYASKDGFMGYIPDYSDRPLIFMDIQKAPTAGYCLFDEYDVTEKGRTFTGAKLTIEGYEPYDEPDYTARVIIYGDAAGGENGLGDGKVDITDLVAMRRFVINSPDGVVNSWSSAAMDFDYSSTIDIFYIAVVRRYIVNFYPMR